MRKGSAIQNVTNPCPHPCYRNPATQVPTVMVPMSGLDWALSPADRRKGYRTYSTMVHTRARKKHAVRSRVSAAWCPESQTIYGPLYEDISLTFLTSMLGSYFLTKTTYVLSLLSKE